MKVRKIEGTTQTCLKNVAAYARVSTLNEEQEESFETQYKFYKKLIKETVGWNFVDVYADRGFSGSCAELRPAFMKMISDAKDGKIDIILVKSVSRFARNAIEANDYLHELKSYNVEIRFDREGISSFDPSADMIFSVLAATAQEEIKSLSEKVKWTNRKLMEKGIHHVGNNHVLGYDEQDGKLVPNKDAWIVKQIFEEYVSGHGMGDIAKQINEKGIKTIRDKEYSFSTIDKILRNEIYVGDRKLQKKAPLNYLTHLPDYTKPFDSRYITDDHEAIIDRDLWNKTQERLKKNKELQNAGFHFKKNNHPLYGKIVCTHCGHPYIRQNTRDGKHIIVKWICANRLNGKGCDAPIIKARHIIKAIKEKEGLDKPDFDKVERIEISDDYEISITLKG